MVVRAVGLGKRYGPVTAVDGVDLRVGAGEVYALLGLNGAGKTTTIRMLLGMVRPTAGSVSLFGTAVGPGRSAVWGRVGYLVETPAAYPELTVRQNLHLVRRLRHLPDRSVVEQVIEQLGLAPYADRRARGLSLGNAQRLGLAKALIHRPELLILDEPANGLDPAGVVEVRQLLRGLADEGTTVVLSSHILTEVARLATRIGIIDQGRLVQELDMAELGRRTRPRLVVAARDRAAVGAALTAAGYHPEPAVGEGWCVTDPRAVNGPDDIAAMLVAAGCPPTHLAVQHEDLETYFMRLVAAAPDEVSAAGGDGDG
jgi:ABC-2 type transport system ATP-binding protein